MKKSTGENIPIAEQLPFDFKNKELSLSGWGRVDFYCEIDDILIFLEVEREQRHPNTNVLKIWPFLEEHSQLKIFLIQIFMESKKKVSPNRLKLCRYVGQKLEELFPDRCRYYSFNWATGVQSHTNNILTKYSELKNDPTTT
ncbi:MAG: hypothetical protein IPM14_01050 [bacterium]|nr:hypothetical protein [bacterium]